MCFWCFVQFSKHVLLKGKLSVERVQYETYESFPGGTKMLALPLVFPPQFFQCFYCIGYRVTALQYYAKSV